MNDKEKIIRDLIKKESLRIIKESQASFLKDVSAEVKHSMEDVNDVIGLFEKKLDKLNNEEKSALSKEDYSELKRIKSEQMDALSKVINGYNTKVKLLNQQKTDLHSQIVDISAKGANVFNNQNMTEFENDNFKKGWVLRIETQRFKLDLVKQVEDGNNYRIVDTNIPGLESGDLAALPNLSIGGSGKVKIYRKINDRYEEIVDGGMELQNIQKMVKNPQ
jgi:hypothetical protein